MGASNTYFLKQDSQETKDKDSEDQSESIKSTVYDCDSIICYWWRNNIDKHKHIELANINNIIIEYAANIYTSLMIRRYISPTECEQLNTEIYLTNKEFNKSLIKNWIDISHINFKKEFILTISKELSEIYNVNLLTDIEITNNNNDKCIMFSIECNQFCRDDGGACAETRHYLWLIVINKIHKFNKIGIKTISKGMGKYDEQTLKKK